MTSGANPISDRYTCSPEITFTAVADASDRTWDAKKDFRTFERLRILIYPFEAPAQDVPVSDEFAIID